MTDPKQEDLAVIIARFFGPTDSPDDAAQAVIAAGWVSPEEHGKYRRGARELGRVIEQQCNSILDITGLHDWVGEDGDGDWGAIWDHAYALRDRAKKAEAAIARVEALAAEMDDQQGQCWNAVAAQRLRAALAEPTEPQ